jgi:hypothetical protein
MGMTLDEREDGDGVAAVESAYDDAITRANRRYHEAEAALLKGLGCSERPGQTLKDFVPCLPEPVLVIEVVDGHEARALFVEGAPVVAAATLRDVFDGCRTESPSAHELVSEEIQLEIDGGMPHAHRR